MLKKIRENKGFTLAELLVVVAIIGILVAVSIPIFTSQLEKAREATDIANLRAAKAAAVAYYLGGTTDTTIQADAPGAAIINCAYNAGTGKLVKTGSGDTCGKGTTAVPAGATATEVMYNNGGTNDYTHQTDAAGKTIIIAISIDGTVDCHFSK